MTTTLTHTVIYLCLKRCVRGLVGSVLDHRSLPPVFESWHGHIWRLFHLWLCFITSGGRSAHLTYHVHKSGRKTSIIIIIVWHHMKLSNTLFVLLFSMMLLTYGLNKSCYLQVTGLPPGVIGVCLHTNMTKVQRKKVMEQVSEGNVHFLLVSPEAMTSSTSARSLLGSSQLPPIAFVCIDEAHCVSEWSHHFRPSYLRICKVLHL